MPIARMTIDCAKIPLGSCRANLGGVESIITLVQCYDQYGKVNLLLQFSGQNKKGPIIL